MRKQRPRLLRILRVRQRRVVAWTDRHAAVLLAWVPSWGTSLLVHGLVILMLALYLYAQNGRDRSGDFQAVFSTQLTEDLNSLGDADHAGDPFTKVKTDEPPSLAVEPSADDEDQPAGGPQPRDRFGPELAGPTAGPAGRGARRGAVAAGEARPGGHGQEPRVDRQPAPRRGHDGAVLGPGRARPGPGSSAARGGRSTRRRRSTNGLDWLARHQRPDGGWSLEFHAQCQGQGCPSHGEGRLSDVGHRPRPGWRSCRSWGPATSTRRSAATRPTSAKGWPGSSATSSRTASCSSGGAGQTRMYSHAIATMALCEAYGLSHDQGLRGPAQRAINFIVRTPRTSRPAAGVTSPASRATPRSSAGRCSRCGAPGSRA